MMVYVSRLLWLVPLAVHVGYAASVYRHFPEMVGRTMDSAGTPVGRFYAFFFCAVVFADAALWAIHGFLPRFPDRMLSVPKKTYWLRSAEAREELVERLRGIIEACLLALNVFYLAVFQGIYQANVLQPTVSLKPLVLLVGFMVLPLLLAAGYFAMTVIALGRDAERSF